MDVEASVTKINCPEMRDRKNEGLYIASEHRFRESCSFVNDPALTPSNNGIILINWLFSDSTRMRPLKRDITVRKIRHKDEIY